MDPSDLYDPTFDDQARDEQWDDMLANEPEDDAFVIVNSCAAGLQHAVEARAHGFHYLSLFTFGTTSAELVNDRVILRVQDGKNWVTIYLPITRAELANLVVGLHIEDMAG